VGAQQDWTKSKWGPTDEIGAANYITPELVVKAAQLQYGPCKREETPMPYGLIIAALALALRSNRALGLMVPNIWSARVCLQSALSLEALSMAAVHRLQDGP
jgi:hypothetical protein